MLCTAAKIFGYVFIAIGILGFVPGITTDHHLLGIFHVNASHNIVHILSGAIALWAAKSAALSRLYFRVIGVVYAFITVLGFFYGDKPLLGFIAHNTADILLHLVIAATALYLGFIANDEDRVAA